MRMVGIEALEKNVGEYVRAATEGEIVAVTDEGRVVAEIVPPRRQVESGDEAVLDKGVREGWLTPAEVDWREPLVDDGPAPSDDPDVGFDVLMAELNADREDR